jgi:hypothetical protein
VGVIAEVRESRLFKAIADFSVVHWLFTITPGLIAGVEARVHGKPPEIVILYFVGLCALMLVVLHYGGLAWTKYVSPKVSLDRVPGNIKRVFIPVVAFVVLLVWSLGFKPKTQPSIGAVTSAPLPSLVQQQSSVHSTTSAPPPASSTSAIEAAKQAENPRSPTKKPKPKPVSTGASTTAGRDINESTSGDCSPINNGDGNTTTCPPPAPPPQQNSIVDNAGRIDGMQIVNPQVTAPPNGSATVLKTQPGSQASEVTIQSPVVSSPPTDSTPATASPTIPNSAAVQLTNSSDNLIMNAVVCDPQTQAVVRVEGSSPGNAIVNSSIGDVQKCRWESIVIFMRDHREDIGNVVDRMGITFEKHWSTLPEVQHIHYSNELAKLRQQLVAASNDPVVFGNVLADLEKNGPPFLLPDLH